MKFKTFCSCLALMYGGEIIAMNCNEENRKFSGEYSVNIADFKMEKKHACEGK